MSKQTDTKIDPPFPPPVLTGRELYDSIMGGIEPDLLSSNFPFAPDAFKGETPEQRAARAKRYNAAFQEYDRRFAKYQDDWNEQLRTYKRHAMEYIEQGAATKEGDQLASLESSLLSDQ